MKHARSDYDRIQDPDGKIPDDEPVFLLRAQDVVAPAVVYYWALRAEERGVDKAVINAVRKHADQMLQWQREHGSKIPDVPDGAIGGGG